MSMQRVRFLALAAIAALFTTGAAPPSPPSGPEVLGTFGEALFGVARFGQVELPSVPPDTSTHLLTPLTPSKKPAVYLGDDLSRVPELSLEALPKGEAGIAVWRKRKGFMMAAALHLNAKEEDGYLKAVLKGRDDLAGLPFIMGKDCRQERKAHIAFTRVSAAVRPGELDERFVNATSGLAATAGTPFGREEIHTAAAAGVAQVLGPASEADRVQAARLLGTMEASATTRELARMAVFSPDAKVRAAALKPLAGRPAKDYAGVIEAGLKYPWPAVAKSAADAAVKLRRKDLLPALVAMLEADDPRAPSRGVARELVRVNHHHNCLLCHAPAARARGDEDVLFADIPLPSLSLPQGRPSTGGYGPPQTNLIVRIDVTYLRQDFSVMQAVKDHGEWPEMQRFDYVVRKRALTDAEAADLRKRLEPKAGELSPYRRAALDALRKLTGDDHGAEAAAWRRHLKMPSA